LAQGVIESSSFISSLGVNVHMNFAGTAYQNVSAVENAMHYLGLTNMRDIGAQPTNVYDTLANDGFHFDFMLYHGAVDLGADMTWFHNFQTAHPGAITALEGPNEVNGWPVTYNGQSGYPGAIALQNAFFKAVNADPVLANIPVVNLSMGVDNAAAYAPLGNLSGAADYGNVHLYTPFGQQPGATFQYYLNIGATDTPGLPMRITETGWTADPSRVSGVDEATQAKLTINNLLDAAKFGISATYIYELADNQYAGADYTSAGMFHSDWSAKPAAVAIHNLTQILGADPGGVTPTSSAPVYSLAGTNANDSSLVFHEKSGTYDIVVWSEPKIWDPNSHTEVAASPHAITINLSQAVGGYSIYDPLTGETATSTSNNSTQSITVNVTDHPVIVELHGGSTGATPPPASGGSTTPPTSGGSTTPPTSSGGPTPPPTNTAPAHTITGAQGNDDLHGTTGNDSISGLAGNDRLYSGGGHDTMTGGAGYDQFVFDFKSSSGGYVQINDFNPQQDMIDILRSDFANLPGAGYITQQAFWQGAGPHSATDRIIYNPTNGNLMYDPDGTGSAPTVTIGHLTPGLTLHTNNILLV
jgi:Ca2+-binding RTX toxin-like protein